MPVPLWITALDPGRLMAVRQLGIVAFDELTVALFVQDRS